MSAWLLALCSGLAWGHSMWPAALTLIEAPGGLVTVRWEVPLRAGRPLPLQTVLPEHCTPTDTPWIRQSTDTRRVERQLDCGAQGLAGHTVGVDGLARTQGDALVVIEHADGRTTSQMLQASASTLVVPAAGAQARWPSRYLAIGVEHIWGGADHLLFVLGLVAITGRRWQLLLKTITAFTVAHSATLGLSATGWICVPRASVEAVIALSILLLAVEGTRATPTSLTARRPWAVAGACGLIHGLGFAGALSEIGLPDDQLLLALLSFNLGVEAGQLVVVGVALAAVALAGRAHLPDPARKLPIYLVGSLSALWVLQRTHSIFTG